MRRLHRASVGCRRGAGCNHSVSLHGRERRVDQKLHLGLLLPNQGTTFDYFDSRGVSRIKAPTLIVVGDADSVRTAHAVAFFELLGGGKVDAGWDGSGMSNARLAILPATTHYNIYSSPQLSAVVAPFLDAPMPGTR